MGWAAWIENSGTGATNSGLIVTAGEDAGDKTLVLRKQDGTETFTVSGNGNVTIGTTDSFTEKLAVAGAMTVRDSISASKFNVYQFGSNSIGYVSTPWPDYVFEEDYDLQTLEEVEKHIEEKGHLPNIPSAEEVEKKGSFSLDEMNKKLLEKVEELTLYLIDQNKRLEKQEQRIKALETELANKKK